METVNQKRLKLRRNAEYWDGERRAKYTGRDHPPLVYDFRPPFLFDCRLNCERRMGIGDQLCLISAIQAVADRVGADRVRVWFDAAFPGSAVAWSMAGLDACDPGTCATCPQDWRYIPCRGHIMESPIGGASRGLYGETVGNPVSQVFFNFGWHNLFCSRAVRLRLTPPPASVAQAERILAKYNEGVFACTPLEVSRGNADCTPIAFGNILR